MIRFRKILRPTVRKSWQLVAWLCPLMILSPGTAADRTSDIQRREIIHAADHSIMMVVPRMEFTMGASDTHPDLPKGSKQTVHPPDVLLARASQAWSQSDEQPLHKVSLSSFAIDRFEVSNAQYWRFLDWMNQTGDHSRCHSSEPKNKDHTPRYWRTFNPHLQNIEYARTAPFAADTFMASQKPVVGVDWFDAFAYAAWAGKRLPTEAEWELAARGADSRRWPWGNEWRWGSANIGGEKTGADVSARGREKDGFIYPAPVGSFPEGQSPFGCDDMAGNAAEWCADWYQSGFYKTASRENPRGPATGEFRVVRGGSSQNYPSNVRCTARAFREPEFKTFTLGFRCAKDF